MKKKKKRKREEEEKMKNKAEKVGLQNVRMLRTNSLLRTRKTWCGGEASATRI